MFKIYPEGYANPWRQFKESIPSGSEIEFKRKKKFKMPLPLIKSQQTIYFSQEKWLTMIVIWRLYCAKFVRKLIASDWYSHHYCNRITKWEQVQLVSEMVSAVSVESESIGVSQEADQVAENSSTINYGEKFIRNGSILNHLYMIHEPK